jgi:uncharacterized RmlC-like cupin family protein
MKIFKSDDYIKMENPNPGKPYRPEILTAEHGAKNLGYVRAFAAGTQVPYHYHNNRESVIIAISGEAISVDGKETQSRQEISFSSRPRETYNDQSVQQGFSLPSILPIPLSPQIC